MVFKSRRSLAFAFEMKSPNFGSLHDGEDWKDYWFESIKISYLSLYVYVFVYMYTLLYNFQSNENKDYLKYWNI